MNATDVDSPRAREPHGAPTPADVQAGALMAGIIAVHYMIPKYLAGTPGLAGICAGCQWCGRFGSVNDARRAHAGHVLDELRSNGCDIVDRGAVLACEECGDPLAQHQFDCSTTDEGINDERE